MEHWHETQYNETQMSNTAMAAMTAKAAAATLQWSENDGAPSEAREVFTDPMLFR